MPRLSRVTATCSSVKWNSEEKSLTGIYVQKDCNHRSLIIHSYCASGRFFDYDGLLKLIDSQNMYKANIKL